MSTPNVPVIPNFEQSGAFLATVLAITAHGGTPADQLAAAETAASVASIVQDAASGNASAFNAEVSSLIGSISNPGLAALAKQAAATAQPYLQVFFNSANAVPLLGATEQAILASVAAGMNQAAQSYITKYGQKPAA